MTSELLTFKASTDGTSTAGDFPLTSDVIRGTTTSLRIPAGFKAKVWCKRISGEPVEVIINYTRDITAATPTWIELDRQVLASRGELSLEKQRPTILRATTGKEAIKISWSQPTAAISHIGVEIEITDE